MAKSLDKLEYSNLIEFVRPTSNDKSPWAQTAPARQPQASISGEEARSFYEELCETETVKTGGMTHIHRSDKHQRRRKTSRRQKQYELSSNKDVADVRSKAGGSSNSESCEQKEEILADDQSWLEAKTINVRTGFRKSNSLNTVIVACTKQTKEVLHRDKQDIVFNKIDGDLTKAGKDKSSDLSYPGLIRTSDYLPHHTTTQNHTHLPKETTCSTPKVSDRVMNHRYSQLLRASQNGDTDEVKSVLELGVNVDFQDIYGWTAAMSAAFEGHVEVLQCLIKSGADLQIRNSQGHTAVSLAQQKQHRRAVQLLESVLNDIHHTRARTVPDMIRDCSGSSVMSKLSFYCEVCKSEFTDTDEKEHVRSTVHLFNTGQKPKDDCFLIPSYNVGYRLMLKSGWDAQRGLGPAGQGPKFPVKTLLKTDRKGLGNEVKEKARVTHFKPHDHSAVDRRNRVQKRVENVRTLSRRAQRAKEKRDRRWEIEMRRHLS